MERKSWFYTAMTELSGAAHTVQSGHLQEQTLDCVRKAMDEHAVELAVIEAAEALYHAQAKMSTYDPEYIQAAYDFIKAVEAMQAGRSE